jgi:glucose uptake protein
VEVFGVSECHSISLLQVQQATAISYGLGQGATIVAAIWGIYIWKEFKNAPQGTNTLLNIMLLCYILGLGLLISAK